MSQVTVIYWNKRWDDQQTIKKKKQPQDKIRQNNSRIEIVQNYIERKNEMKCPVKIKEDKAGKETKATDRRQIQKKR